MNITANLFVQRGLYYVILSYRDSTNKRKQKWVPTGITEKGNNKRLANQKLEEIKRDYKQYLPAECSFETNEAEKYFEVYIDEWLENYKHQIEEDTYNTYKTVIIKTKEYFKGKNIKLKDLKPIHIQKFYESLYKKGLTANTVLHYHANIRKSLEDAMKLDIIPSNPADKIQRPKKEQFIGDVYNLEELQTLFEKSKDDPLEIVIQIASFYGLRRSEVLGLKWSAFDFVNNTITIKHKVIETIVDDKRTILLKDKTKNSSSYRSLPLIPEIKEKLLEHKKKIETNKKLCGNSYLYTHLESNTKNISANALAEAIVF